MLMTVQDCRSKDIASFLESLICYPINKTLNILFLWEANQNLKGYYILIKILHIIHVIKINVILI